MAYPLGVSTWALDWRGPLPTHTITAAEALAKGCKAGSRRLRPTQRAKRLDPPSDKVQAVTSSVRKRSTNRVQ
jgi:hypothetical protein